MRPRPGGRGEAGPGARSSCRSSWLQCGHDPEAVESSADAVLAALKKELQCGHDPEAVESGHSNSPAAARQELQCGHDPEAVESR